MHDKAMTHVSAIETNHTEERETKVLQSKGRYPSLHVMLGWSHANKHFP